MPYLPIAPALTNWMMNDGFVVLRRTETIDYTGRGQIAVSTTFPKIGGVVTPASANDLARVPDYDMQRKAIMVIAPFAFVGALAGGGAKPDWIVWNGDTYEVVDVQSYERYGLGFTQVIAGIVTVQPNTP